MNLKTTILYLSALSLIPLGLVVAALLGGGEGIRMALNGTAIALVAGFFLVAALGRTYIRVLSFRYLTRRLLTYIAIGLISLAVAMLVFAPSIMNGFSDEFLGKVRGTLSDLMVWGPRPFYFPAPPTYQDLNDTELRRAAQIKNLEEIYKTFRSAPGVAEISPYIENPALYKNFERIDYCFVRGCVPELEASISKLESYLLSPQETLRQLYEDDLRNAKSPEERSVILAEIDKAPDSLDAKAIFKAVREGADGVHTITRKPLGRFPGVIVGIYFLKAFDLQIGDVLELSTASDSQEVTENNKFTIVGVYRSGFYEQDRRKLFMSLKAAQDFVKIEERISGISIKCVEGRAAEEVRPEIGERVQRLIAEGKFPSRSLARTWKEKDQTLLQAVQMEKLLIRMLMFIMVVLAMGSIFVVLYMSVREKARDLGVLKALGGTPRGILSIYVGQGVAMSLLGVLVGLGVGLFLSLRVNEVCDVIQALTGWHPFPPDVYYLDRIPSKIDFGEVLQTIVATTVFAILLSIIPGLWAANLDPIEATRID